MSAPIADGTRVERTPEQIEADRIESDRWNAEYQAKRAAEREAFLAAAPRYVCKDGGYARSLTMLGRCRNGCEADSGKLWRIVPEKSGKALCGAKPGERSVGWSDVQDIEATCPRCLKCL